MVKPYKGPFWPSQRRGFWSQAYTAATGQRPSFLDSTEAIQADARAGQPTSQMRTTSRRWGVKLPADATYGDAVDRIAAAQGRFSRRRLAREGGLEPDAPRGFGAARKRARRTLRGGS